MAHHPQANLAKTGNHIWRFAAGIMQCMVGGAGPFGRVFGFNPPATTQIYEAFGVQPLFLARPPLAPTSDASGLGNRSKVIIASATFFERCSPG